MGRYQQTGDEPLLHSMRLRVSESERRHITGQAAAADLTVSEYLRRCAAGRVIMSRTDDVVIRELRRIGGLMKHVHTESRGAYSEDTAAALRAVRDAVARVARSGGAP